jgi:PAS domain S-box-containing protein
MHVDASESVDSDLLLVVDVHGRVVHWNEACARRLGAVEVGGRAHPVLPEPARESIAAMLALVQSGERRPRLEGWPTGSGEHIDWNVTVTPALDGAPALVRCTGFARDASTSASMGVGEDGIISIAFDAIVSVNGAQRIVSVNDSAEKVFGYSRAELLGQPIALLLPGSPLDGHAGGQSLHDLARSLGGQRAEFIGRRRNGAEFLAEAVIARHVYGDAPHFTIVLRDVTEDRRVALEQRVLTESGVLLAASLDADRIIDVILSVVVRHLAEVCTIEIFGPTPADRRVRAVHSDPSMSAATARYEAFRRTVGPIRSDEARASRQPLLVSVVTEAHLSPPLVSTAESELLRALQPRSMLLTPLLMQGAVIGTLSLMSTSRIFTTRDVDLAEQVAVRASLALENARLYKAAYEAVHARDEVLDVVAHDLRNPLAAIALSAATLKREVGPGAEAPLSTIFRALRRVDRLIQDLLDVRRIDGGRLAIVRSWFDASALLAEVLVQERELASAAGISLVLDEPPGALRVWADRDRLLQVFENLVGNALKFTPHGGRVTIGARPGAAGDDALFWVTDTGEGIPPEQLPSVFDRFWQAAPTRFAGAGLGLAICRGIVEAHGGSIRVESAVGRGSTFLIHLPASTGGGG